MPTADKIRNAVQEGLFGANNSKAMTQGNPPQSSNDILGKFLPSNIEADQIMRADWESRGQLVFAMAKRHLGPVCMAVSVIIDVADTAGYEGRPLWLLRKWDTSRDLTALCVREAGGWAMSNDQAATFAEDIGSGYTPEIWEPVTEGFIPPQLDEWSIVLRGGDLSGVAEN